MKNKSSLTLMELVIMILVFAFTAAFCLMAFVWADQSSEAQVARDHAIVEVQNMAETLKYSHGQDCENIEAIYFAENWEKTERDGEWSYVLNVEPDWDEEDLLGGALVKVSDKEGQEVFSLPVKWQEVAAHEE